MVYYCVTQGFLHYIRSSSHVSRVTSPDGLIGIEERAGGGGIWAGLKLRLGEGGAAQPGREGERGEEGGREGGRVGGGEEGGREGRSWQEGGREGGEEREGKEGGRGWREGGRE